MSSPSRVMEAAGNTFSFTSPQGSAPRMKSSDFLASKSEDFILGADPCGLVNEKVFPAASITRDGELIGYVYLIVHGREYDSLDQMLFDSYILRLGARSLLVTLVAAGFVALFVLAL